MLKTTTVSELRSDQSELIKNLGDGPLLVLSRSHPVAVMVEPEMFEAIIDKCELLEDLVDGRRAVSEYIEDKDIAVDAEEVFERLGH
jgi:PHD/YefM family antitoxin component YafN of YafNO toxin-antitoxin module